MTEHFLKFFCVLPGRQQKIFEHNGAVLTAVLNVSVQSWKYQSSEYTAPRTNWTML